MTTTQNTRPAHTRIVTSILTRGAVSGLYHTYIRVFHQYGPGYFTSFIAR